MEYIVSKEQIEEMEGLDKTHFLNQNAKRINKSLGDLTGLTKIGFHIIEVEPGRESTEYHLHHSEDECVYVLSGEATVIIDGKDYGIRAGDFIGYPAGGPPHTMKNTGKELLKCIVVGQRLSEEVADYPNLGKRLYRHGKVVDLVDTTEIKNPSVGKKA